MSGKAHTSITVSAFADTELTIRLSDKGVVVVRIGDITDQSAMVILHEDAAARLYAALGEALKASEPQDNREAA